MDPVQAGDTVGCFWGCPPLCVCAQEGEALWAGALCQAVEQGGHTSTEFVGFWFFFPYFSRTMPGGAFTRFLR